MFSSAIQLGSFLLVTAVASATPNGPAVIAAGLPAAVAPVDSTDEQRVRRAVLDYIEGFYEGDSVKLVRALHPEMHKFGFWKANNATTYSRSAMSFAQAMEYARKFREAKRVTPPTAPREVVVYEAQDQTASAKITAVWGTDYMLLGKYDGQWKITHVIWQGPLPPKK